MDETGHQRGVVAVGDSFANGYGLPMAGVTCSSWATWLAWALMTCLTQHAVNGATCEQVERDQLPLLEPGGYRLGLIWLGANDIARLDRPSFSNRLRAVCEGVATAADISAIGTLPSALTAVGSTQHTHARGHQQVNEVIRDVAAGTGVVLVELEGALLGRWSMAPDHEHPTALGQLEAARCAAAALADAGLPFVRHLPRPDLLEPTAAEHRLYRPAPGLRERVAGRLQRSRVPAAKTGT